MAIDIVVAPDAWARFDTASAEGQLLVEELVQHCISESCELVSDEMRASGLPEEHIHVALRMTERWVREFVSQQIALAQRSAVVH